MSIFQFPKNLDEILRITKVSRSPSRLLRVPPREDIKKDFFPVGYTFNILYGEAPPERGTFLKFQVYEKVGISLVEVNERVMKSVIARKL